jgi:hypothetical protein
MIFRPSFDITRRPVPDVARRPTFEMAAEVRREDVRYEMGVDLGQAHDPTAICVTRRLRFLLSTTSGSTWTEEKPAIFQVGYLERVPLGTTYPAIVAHVGRLLQRPIWAGKIDLAIDQTGVGRPVCNIFESAGITFTAVTITGGDAESYEGREHHHRCDHWRQRHSSGRHAGLGDNSYQWEPHRRRGPPERVSRRRINDEQRRERVSRNSGRQNGDLFHHARRELALDPERVKGDAENAENFGTAG